MVFFVDLLMLFVFEKCQDIIQTVKRHLVLPVQQCYDDLSCRSCCELIAKIDYNEWLKKTLPLFLLTPVSEKLLNFQTKINFPVNNKVTRI